VDTIFQGHPFSTASETPLTSESESTTSNAEALGPLLCNNERCTVRASCAKFYDVYRAEFKDMKPPFSVQTFIKEVDNCFVLRKQLEGTMDNQRKWSKTTKHHRRRKGEWL